MKCPRCGINGDRVLETRTSQAGSIVRRRREESVARMVDHNKLTTQEKIQKTEKRRGHSAREIGRLKTLLIHEKHHSKKPKKKLAKGS